jgi:hypothetical protein
MSKTLLRHTLTKNIFDIFVDFLILIHFHLMKIHRLLSSLQRRNIFRQALTTILPILFQYCYKYCYSDSRNLWAVMKAGDFASSNMIQGIGYNSYPLVYRRPAETVSLQRRQICYRWAPPVYKWKCIRIRKSTKMSKIFFVNVWRKSVFDIYFRS